MANVFDQNPEVCIEGKIQRDRWDLTSAKSISALAAM
jgi:hypothetical protein